MLSGAVGSLAHVPYNAKEWIERLLVDTAASSNTTERLSNAHLSVTKKTIPLVHVTET